MTTLHRPSSMLVISFVAAMSLSCAATPPKEPVAAAPTAPVAACPLGIEGAAVASEDAPDGIVLKFTTKGDPTELRQRVFDASAMYGTGKGFGKGHDGKHGEGGHHGLQTMQLPPVTAGSAEIEGGARIHFVPVDPVDVETIRTKLRARATELNTAPCKG